MNYCSEIKENLRCICVAQSSQNFYPWNITSKAHKIRTTLKQRWIFKRASGNRCLHDAGKTRPPRKAAAAAAVLCQYIEDPKSNYTRKEKDQITRGQEFGLQFLDDRRGEDIHLKRLSSSKSTSTPWWEVDNGRSECNVSRNHTSSIENGRVYKIPKLTGKRSSRVRMGRIAFTAEASKQVWNLWRWRWKIERYSCDPKTFSVRWLFYQDWRVKWKILHRSKIHLHRGSSTRSLLYYRSWIGIRREKKRKEGVHTLAQEGSQALSSQLLTMFRQRCQCSTSNNRYKEIEEGESSTSLTTWARCKVLNSLVRNAETNFGKQSLSHH